MTTVVETPTRAPTRHYVIGLWLFMASESMIFLALLASRLYLVGTDVPDEANQFVALVITSILLLSSFSAYTAERAFTEGDDRRFVRALTATIAFGALFLIGVGVEWSEAFDAFGPETSYGTVFFTMTGMHAFHVLTGLVVLGIVFRMTRVRPERDPWPVEAAVKYWHFVDIVWVFFYPALYLIG